MKNSEAIYLDLILKKFGTKNADRINELVDRLISKDVLIVDKKSSYIENLLSLKEKDVVKAVDFLNDLSTTSYFAAAFFIEKIPLLYFYDLFDDYILVLALTRHYSSRSLAYSLGSSDLISNDLSFNVKNLNIKLYKNVLKIIIKRHKELDLVSLHILRYVGKIFTNINEKDIPLFFDICIQIKNDYGANVATNFIDNIEPLLLKVPLKKVLQVFKNLNKVSTDFLLFSINYPQSLNIKNVKNKNKNKSLKNKNIKLLKIQVLENEEYSLIDNYPKLLEDKYFIAILMSWKKYPTYHKKNVIQQLKTKDLKQLVVNNRGISKDVKQINRKTNNNWFKQWSYAGKPIDNYFIYEEIKKILLPSVYFKFNTKKIYNEKKSLFEAIKVNPKTDHLIYLINYLISISKNKEISQDLKNLKSYLKKPTDLFLKKYSNNGLFIKTWDRDPWVDYARSDELYACTSIGEATDYFAPAYLFDITNNNLDIYNNIQRIGRMHFFIIKDNENNEILLFDCIDGSDRLMRNETRLNFLLECIKTYAKFININNVFFNTDLMFNNTPKHFVNFLKNKFNDEQFIYVKRYLNNASQKQFMPYPLISFSESLKEKNEGIIKGFLVNLATNEGIK